MATKTKQAVGPAGPAGRVGRPRISDRLGKPMWVRLHPEHDRELRELAEAEVREPSNMARALIVEALEGRRARKLAQGAQEGQGAA